MPTEPSHKMLRRIGRTSNPFLKGAVTLTMPRLFFRRFYSCTPRNGRYAGKATISFDCDYSADAEALPALMNVLDSYDFKASFACVGKLIERHPAQHRLVVDRGHEIVNHTYSHPFNKELGSSERFDEIPVSAQKEQVTGCHRVCKTHLEYEPIGFRTPHFSVQYTDTIYPILAELGYKYSTSTLAVKTDSCGLPFQVGKTWEFPISVCPWHPFQAFDTYHAFRSNVTSHKDEDEYFRAFEKMISIISANGGYLCTYFDPQDIAKFNDFGRFLESISENMKPFRFVDLVRARGDD